MTDRCFQKIAATLRLLLEEVSKLKEKSEKRLRKKKSANRMKTIVTSWSSWSKPGESEKKRNVLWS